MFGYYHIFICELIILIRLQGGLTAMENLFIRADEVMQMLGVSKSYAYKVIREMNSELKAKGYHTIAGRVSKKYFLEKVQYHTAERRN